MLHAGAGMTGSRRLLGRLRDAMADHGSAQQRLDKVVQIIADEMQAEVCSVYVMRAGEVLELFATQGLKPEAVHMTRLRVGEGLVGEIAAHGHPLNLADAQQHPNFAYRPETGEEIYHSLMGVPILRSGRTVGVLVVQNRAKRHYFEEEVEALQTVAMVLAELVASGDLVSPDEMVRVDGIALLPLRMEGMRLNAGIGMGIAVLHQPRIVIRQMVAENPDKEIERLHEAVRGMHDSLDRMLASSDFEDGGEHRDILETYRMFAQDTGWLRRIEEAIGTGLTAEAAVQKVHGDTRTRMAQVTDPYLRERLLDLEDLALRLQQHLTGAGKTAASLDLPDDVVLIARSMGPAEFLDYDRKRLRALVLEEGSATCHVAIVARALDVPVVGRVKDVLTMIEAGDPVIVDGDNGQLFIRPAEDVVQAFAENVKARAERRAAFAALKDLPATTRDGAEITLNLNAGLLVDVQHLEDSGATGIGLYRTEIPFMARPSFPDVERQAKLYSQVLDVAGDKPVIFRTLDVGGDKILPYWQSAAEDNPAMGWRAIRITLDRPAMLRQQLRALIRAGGGRRLHVMFPMIAQVQEMIDARKLLDMEMKRATERGAAMPIELKVGAMLEVPALYWQLPALLPRVDFLSVGSNDLFQFLFACDRGNPRLAERYDVLSPGALYFLRNLVKKCEASGVPLSVCGEMGGRPLEAMALIGIGMRSISMHPAAIGPVKAMVRSLLVEPLRNYLESLYHQPYHSVREKLRAYALDHGVVI